MHPMRLLAVLLMALALLVQPGRCADERIAELPVERGGSPSAEEEAGLEEALPFSVLAARTEGGTPHLLARHGTQELAEGARRLHVPPPRG